MHCGNSVSADSGGSVALGSCGLFLNGVGGPKFESPAVEPATGNGGIGGDETGSENGLGLPEANGATGCPLGGKGVLLGAAIGGGRFAPGRCILGRCVPLGGRGGASLTWRSSGGLESGPNGVGSKGSLGLANGAVIDSPQLGQGPDTPAISRGTRNAVWQHWQAKLISD